MSVLELKSRERSGKGAARALRREGLLPGVVYGGKEEPTGVQMDAHSFMLAARVEGFFSHLQTLKLDGKEIKVLARSVERHPVSGDIEHVDFLRIDPKQMIKVKVPVHVVGQDVCPGIKIGGVLQMVRNEVELLCRADAIPAFLTLDISSVKIAESAHMSMITLPEGCETTIDRDFTVATIVSTRQSTLAEKAAEGAEGEATEEAAE